MKAEIYGIEIETLDDLFFLAKMVKLVRFLFIMRLYPDLAYLLKNLCLT